METFVIFSLGILASFLTGILLPLTKGPGLLKSMAAPTLGAVSGSVAIHGIDMLTGHTFAAAEGVLVYFVLLVFGFCLSPWRGRR